MLDRFRQRTWSIQAQFLLYSLALLVPALIFSGLMIMRSASLERAAMELETTETVRTIALSIDRELAATTVTLKALGSSPSLAEGSLDAFYKQALAAQEVGGTHFFLTSKSGKQLLNTRAEWGAPLPEVSPTTGRMWSIAASRRSRVSTTASWPRGRCSASAYR